MSAFLDLHREDVAKGYVGDKVVEFKTLLANRKAKKAKKANMVLRPMKTMSTLMGVAKAGCDCKECEAKGLKCSECKKCSMDKVAKGRYSETIEGVQRDRQKANRRRSAGNAFLGGAAVAGGMALAAPDETKRWVRRGGQELQNEGGKAVWRSGGNFVTRSARQSDGTMGRAYTEFVKPRTGSNAGFRAGSAMYRAGRVVVNSPGKAAAGVIGGAALAGAGLKGAGMAHNARSNRNARKYNKTKANSRIKIVPTSGKNRF
jgi:hypothetical protein